MEHKSIRNVMFHANDVLKHDVYWSSLGQRWTVENENGIVKSYETLCSALTTMHVLTNTVKNYGPDYCMLVPNNWTVTDNPYERARHE